MTKQGVKIWTVGDTLYAHGATWHFKPGVSRLDFKDKYKRNPIHAERDYAAEPPDAVESALTDKSLVERMVNKARISPIDADGAYHPWFVGEPQFEYYAHIDMSKVNDDTGLSICHYDMEDDKVVVDLIQTIENKVDWNLSFERIHALILSWRALGFNFKRITFDQWQSYNMIERLVNAGIPAELFSVDRGTEAYDTLIEVILTGHLDYYLQARFIQEMNELKLYKGNKYDHPPEGSKDTSDAVAGAVTNCVKDRIGLALKPTEIQAALHDEHVFSIIRTTHEHGRTTFEVDNTEVPSEERTRKRVARIDVNDQHLIFIIGWYDKKEERLFVDEYLLWEFYDDDSLANLQQFTVKLMQFIPIDAFSLNENIPLEYVNFLKNTGRRIDSPLMTRGTTQQKGMSKVAKVHAVNDSSIRVTISNLKKGHLSVPHNPHLVKDLKFMTDENQRHRNYVKALSAWVSFVSAEMSFGRAAINPPKLRAGVGAAINPVMRQTQPTTSSAKVGTGDIDRLRMKYGVSQISSKKQEDKQQSEQKAPLRAPRIRRL